MLQNRKQQVTIVTQENSYLINLTEQQLNDGEEIEMYIVKNIVDKHKAFMNNFNKGS